MFLIFFDILCTIVWIEIFQMFAPREYEAEEANIKGGYQLLEWNESLNEVLLFKTVQVYTSHF